MSTAIDISAGNSRTIVRGIVGLGVAAAVCLAPPGRGAATGPSSPVSPYRPPSTQSGR